MINFLQLLDHYGISFVITAIVVFYIVKVLNMGLNHMRLLSLRKTSTPRSVEHLCRLHIFLLQLINKVLQQILNSNPVFIRAYISSVSEDNRLRTLMSALRSSYSETDLEGFNLTMLENGIEQMLPLLKNSGAKSLFHTSISLKNTYFFIIESSQELTKQEKEDIHYKWDLPITLLLTIYNELLPFMEEK